MTSVESNRDPADALDFRLDAGPPPRKVFSAKITISFEAIKKFVRRIFRC